MPSGDPNHKGNVAELAIAAAATKLGIDVSKPLVEHARYDLIFDLRPRLLRIQCKYASRSGEVIRVGLATNRRGPRGFVRTTYGQDEIDAVVAYCGELDRCYLIGAGEVAGRGALQLRLSPPRNGQRAALNWAADYELSGAVAQLGERLAGSEEARGSSPLSSTFAEPSTTVGAHKFRNHFGWYMERAEAGERITVTKRGRPTVQLTALTHQSRLEPPAPGGENRVAERSPWG